MITKRYYPLDSKKHSTTLNWESILKSVNPNYYTYIDSNAGDFILAWGKEDDLIQNTYSIEPLKEFETKYSNQYLFGYLGYDAKQAFYTSETSKNSDFHELPESIFYVPKHIILNKNGALLYYGTESGLEEVKKIKKPTLNETKIFKPIKLICNTNYKSYKKNIESIHNHLQLGNIYEMNYCLNFTKTSCNLNIIESFKVLKTNTKAPFSTLFKFNSATILSASPERFFSKKGKTILSQPIKGTAPRDKNIKIDNQIKKDLLANKKEISENIMIVDLVRNDLSIIANKRSVSVPELCELYSFETVHQLISTVRAEISSEMTFTDIVKHIFPMGSMTGAPKLSAIKIIETQETFKRNIYSGTVGFIDPMNNMDFNVVIRSILYNSTLKNISISVGGAITIKSTAKGEYDECLLKLKKIEESICLDA